MLNDIKDILRSDYNYKSKDDREEIGIGGFTLDVRINEAVDLSSTVTENPVEDGSVVGDHIINNPIQLSIEGEVAEIKRRVAPVQLPFGATADKMVAMVGNIYPIPRTEQQLTKIKRLAQPTIQAINKINDAIDGGEELYNYLFRDDGGTIQDAFFQYMELIYTNKLLINIESPFKVYDNMRIVSMTVIKDNETDQRLKYKITAKQVRFASTVLISKDSVKKYFKNPTGSAGIKTASKENKGVQEGKKIDSSILGNIVDYIKG